MKMVGPDIQRPKSPFSNSASLLDPNLDRRSLMRIKLDRRLFEQPVLGFFSARAGGNAGVPYLR